MPAKVRTCFSLGVMLVATAAGRGALADEPSPPPGPEPPAAATAPAEPSQSQEEVLATELFNAARDLMAAGRHAEACPKLVESARLSNKVGTLGKLAECEEKRGRLVSARARFQQALNLARAQDDERLPIVERELARLDAVVPRLLLSVAGAAPAGLAIAVDKVEVGASALGTPLPVDPGPHTVVATAPGKKAWSTTVQLAGDGKITALSVPELESAESPAPPPPPSPPGRSPLAVAGILATGLGAGAIGVGAFFGGRAVTRLDESNRAGCMGNACTPAAAAIRNDARAAGDASTALFVAGAALFAGGLTLWLLSPAPAASPSPAPRVGLTVAFDSVSLKGTF